jgi:competence protein ComEA
VMVPERGPGGTIATTGAGVEDGPIGLGSATVEQLETIDGIGPVTAGKIVEYRDQHGGLASVDQLDQVSGIGPATMESLRARLQP